MKFINTIMTYIFIGFIIVLLYLFFPSVNQYINKFGNDIDNNKDLLVDKINNSEAIKSIGSLVKNGFIPKDYGYLGEEYTFDSEIYPYYYILNEDGKALYKQIYANSINKKSSFTPIIDINKDDVAQVVECVMYDHPELFYLDNKYSFKYDPKGTCLEIGLSYNNLVDNYVYNKEIFEYNIDSIVEKANLYKSDYQKEKYVHDTLVDMFNYDNYADNNQTAYSAIVNHSSVCAGYSKAFQYIMQKLNIPCYYVTGYSNGDHAWNIVKLGDYYYNVDLTWDNTGNNRYSYFNKNDSDFSNTHQRSNLSSYLVNCDGDSYILNKKENSSNFIIDFKYD